MVKSLNIYKMTSELTLRKRANSSGIRDIQLDNLQATNASDELYVSKMVNYLSLASGEISLQLLFKFLKGKNSLTWQEINMLFRLADQAYIARELRMRERGLLLPSWLGYLTCNECGMTVAGKREELAVKINILGHNFHGCGGQFQMRNWLLPPPWSLEGNARSHLTP